MFETTFGFILLAISSALYIVSQSAKMEYII